MDVDDIYEDEDDFYAPEEPAATVDGKDAKDTKDTKDAEGGEDSRVTAEAGASKVGGGGDDGLEEGEEEDQGGDQGGDMDEDDSQDSDIDIITERPDGSKAAPPPQPRYSDIRNIPQRTASGGVSSSRPKAAASGTKQEEPKPSPRHATAVPTADKAAAAASSSKLDINGNPVYKPVGKPIMQVNIDEDLPDNEKPWRKPGTDITDYFNYGFDEFTWALYASKQDSLRSEYNQDLLAANNKKMMDDFNLMMMGGMPGGMPGMPGAAPPTGPAGASAAAAAGAQGAVPGSMDGMPPEMQAMFQQMVASGMDPTQIDPASMAAMFGGGMPGQGAQAQAGFGQAFGGQGQYGGYDGGMGGGGRGGRGRGGRRW